MEGLTAKDEHAPTEEMYSCTASVNRTRLASLDLNLLVVLDVMLVERNVTRTARRLCVSQPAVSNALGRLRKTFGDPLFVRSPRGMVPTPRAIALEHPLRFALGRVAQALDSDSEPFDPRTTRRSFALAATDYVEFVLLTPLVRRLEREAPGISLNVYPIVQRPPWHELESGEIEIALGPVRAGPKGLKRQALFRDRVVCIVREDHPCVRGDMTLERYLALSHVEAVPLGSQALADKVLAALGHSRRIGVTVRHFLAAPPIVAGSDYCFTLAARMAMPLADCYRLRVLPLPFAVPEFTMATYWHDRSHTDAGHRWLRSVIAQVASSLDDAPAPVSTVRVAGT
jgi:DNA-binding transcriptional LysR family regulator